MGFQQIKLEIFSIYNLDPMHGLLRAKFVVVSMAVELCQL